MKINGIEIKDGYLLVVKDGNKTVNMTVVHDKFDELGCVAPGKHWCPVACFDKNGKYAPLEIVAIYGRTSNMHLLDNSTDKRELLWERKEVKKMTVAEICKELGYEVEIVKD